MAGQAFKRFHIVMAAVSKLMSGDASKGILPIPWEQALFQAPAYYSRGKGGKQAHKTGHKHMAYVRAQRKK